MNARHLAVRRLTAAVALMFVGVLGLALLLWRAAEIVSSTDDDVTGDYAPSVVALDSLLANLRKVHVLINERELDEPGHAAARQAEIASVRRDLDRDARTYFALPIDPGEAGLVRALTDSLERFNAATDRLLAAPPEVTAPSPRLLSDVDAARTAVDADLIRATDFNADLAERAAITSKRVTHTLIPTAAVLGVAGVLAAATVIALAYRSVLQAEALAEQGRRALERRAEELEAFAGRVAHDLLSPLGTVGLSIDITKRYIESDIQHAFAALERATKTLQRVRRFVDDLLEFARAGAVPSSAARAEVDEIVHEVAEEFAPLAIEADVELDVEPTPESIVSCSPGVLTSLLSNLVQNAIKYLGDSRRRRVVIRSFDLGDEVRLEVEDSGPGIEPSDQERVFEPYARGRDAKVPGLGLGLATVRRLAETHGGHAGVRSQLGQGSVFWITLPVVH